MYFLQRDEGTAPITLSETLKQALNHYPWPGNIRELKNEMEYMKVMDRDKTHYDIDDLKPSFFNKVTSQKNDLPLDQTQQSRDQPRRTQANSPWLNTPPMWNIHSSAMRRREAIKELFNQ